jgi:tocopherol O-methyltransferase
MTTASSQRKDPSPNSEEVGLSYDLLDEIYHGTSLPHVHHGLWISGLETREQAKDMLGNWMADYLALKSGETCIDIGSGYGQMARQLAKARGIRVTAITNSVVQYSKALSVGATPSVDYILGDWCKNDLPTGEFDAAWAVESIEHMSNLDLAIKRCHNVLKDGGRLVILTWLAREPNVRWRAKIVLDSIVKDAALAPLRTHQQITKSLSLAGFNRIQSYDLSDNVSRTWVPTMKGVLGRAGLLTDETLEPGLSWRTLRIALAYRFNLLSYCAIKSVAAQRPSSD